ncbi:diacylglycerol/lipid kinase family protein [Vulgatibacter sp.]|uniref:diacylglycerol/lipid kinase family protein n=1 Tax=Vulgatibacter sp. TaxID=1971226 RepID=UPI00356A49AF
MGRRVVFVINPSSGNGSTGREWRAIASRIHERIGDFGELYTTRPLEATQLANRALEGGADVVVAVGGDGTTNEVVNGFFGPDGKPVRRGATLAVLPRGTGSDFLKSFHTTNTVDALALRLAAGKVRKLDVGRLRYVDHGGAEQLRHFVNIASFGSSGLIDRYVNASTKALGGKASFAIGAVRGLLAWKDQRVQLRFDDGPWEEMSITCVSVANGQFFGGGMWVAPDAQVDDGLFDVTIWSGYTLLDFVTKSRKIYDGSHVKMPGTRTLRARKVEARCDAECLLDVDGEAPGRLPATFEIVPGALTLLA